MFCKVRGQSMGTYLIYSKNLKTTPPKHERVPWNNSNIIQSYENQQFYYMSLNSGKISCRNTHSAKMISKTIHKVRSCCLCGMNTGGSCRWHLISHYNLEFTEHSLGFYLILIFMTALWGRYHCWRFTDEKIKAQRESNVIQLLSIITRMEMFWPPRINLFCNNHSYAYQTNSYTGEEDIFPTFQILLRTHIFQTQKFTSSSATW